MSKMQTLVARARKLAVSFLLLLVFVFPAFLTTRWIYGVLTNPDPRDVFSAEKIDSFADAQYQGNHGAVRPFAEPLITITFDDGWESIYYAGLPVLEKYDIDTTQYIVGGEFDNHLYLSEEQVRSMQAHGHEVGSHTMTHPNLTTLAEGNLAWEIGESGWTLANKFGPTKDFAAPLGATNERVMRYVKQHYRSQRNTAADPKTVDDKDINVADTFDIYNINAYTVRNTTTLNDIKRLIDHTIKQNGWLILTYHQIDDSDSQYAVTSDTLDAQLKLVRKSGIKIPTMAQVLNTLESHEHGGTR